MARSSVNTAELSVMTIKTTIAYGKNFHFYHEGVDKRQVYLELEDVVYDAGYRRVMVAIPIDVWETIRGLAAANFDLVNSSDEELQRLAEKSVEFRIAKYQKILKTKPEEADAVCFENAMIFGSADEPKDKQVHRGVQFYKTERACQLSILGRMAQHKILNIRGEQPPNVSK
jgi:hypothetical protein